MQSQISRVFVGTLCKSKQTALSSIKSAEERGRIRVSPLISDIHFGNKHNLYNALVDSGSDVSLIDWSVFDKIPSRNVVKFDRNTISPLTSAAGHVIETIGKTTVVMSMNGQYYVGNFILTKGLKFEILIGSDFIYDHGAKCDCK